MELNVLLHDIRTIEVDAVGVGFFEDVRPLKGGAGAIDWLLCGALSRLVMENRIRGALGEVALLTTGGKTGAGKVFLFGLGRREMLSPDTTRVAARSVAASIAAAGARRAALDIFPLHDEERDALVAAVREGLREGAGSHSLAVSLLAEDTASCERISRALRD